MRKKEIAVITCAAWVIIVSLYMLLAQQFNLEIFCVLGFIGIFAVIALMEPRYVQPGYQRKKWYLIAAWIVIFGAIVTNNVMQTLL